MLTTIFLVILCIVWVCLFIRYIVYTIRAVQEERSYYGHMLVPTKKEIFRDGMLILGFLIILVVIILL